MSTVLEAPQYAGILRAIRPTVDNTSNDAAQDEIDDDIDGEKETLLAEEVVPEDCASESDDSASESDDSEGDSKMADLTRMHAVIAEASKGVTEGTDAEYKRHIKLCEKFVHEKHFIPANEEFFTSTPPADAPAFIVAWIMNSCDDIELDGKPKDPSTVTDSYSHAQKMRAAATYGFGRLAGLGSLPWQKSEVTRRMVGNPSISEGVSRYMVRAGEVATSARAITPEILEELYYYNNRPEVAEIKPITRRKRNDAADINQWGGGRSRKMLHAVYIISFLCLLRFDEALKIQLQDIRWLSDSSFELTLPFRKTSQYGDIKPFVLHELPEDQAHLCPVRALTAWLACLGNEDGYLFPTITVRDQIGDGFKPMKSDKFLEMFRNNLLDIGLDPYPYGTHSFRRGGCQYFATYRRWSLRRICEWGGWSMEFSNLTIVKYLIGWNDDPTELRENFLNPNQKVTQRCSACGRTCACGL